MSGFNFGGFDLTSLTDIGDTLQKLKEDVESTLDVAFFDQASGTADGVTKDAEDGNNEEDWLGFDVIRSVLGVPEGPGIATNKQNEVQDTNVFDGAQSQSPPPEAARRDEEEDDTIATVSTLATGKDNDEKEITEESPQPQQPPTQQDHHQQQQSGYTDSSPTSTFSPILDPTKNAENTQSSVEWSSPLEIQTDAEQAASTVALGLEAAAAAATSSSAIAGALIPSSSSDLNKIPEESEKQEMVDYSMNAKSAQNEHNVVDLNALVTQLKETLTAREAQLERQAQDAAATASALEALKRKTEAESALSTSKRRVSDKDIEAVKKQYEEKIAEIVRKKDAEIQEIMDEGEALSKKQLSQETMIKQLRAQTRQLKDEVESLTGRLESEQHRISNIEKEKESLKAALVAAQEQQADQLAAERQHFERMLGEARTSAAVAEKKAENVLKSGAAKRLKDAESRIAVLEGTVEQLREELERKRATADEREDLLSHEVSELQRRCAEAEARQQELQAKLPEATAPFMRQLEAMTAAAETAAEKAAVREKELQEQVAAAEDAAVEAQKVAEMMSRAVQEAETRIVELDEKLEMARNELKVAVAQVDEDRKARLAAENEVERLQNEIRASKDSITTLERVYAQQMEALQARESEAAQAAAALKEELSSRKKATTSNEVSSQHSPNTSAHAPPALAASGFKWVMIKEENEQGDADENSGTFSHFTLPAAGGLVSAVAARLQQQQRQTFASVQDPNAPGDKVSSLLKTIQDLERTRDRLSEELVRAESEAATGRTMAAKAATLEVEVASLQQRNASAIELLGEREERIEELATDIVDMREGYRQQISTLADEIERLRQRISELEAL